MLEIKTAADISPYISKIKELDLPEEMCIVAESFSGGLVNGWGIYHLADEGVSVDFVESGGDILLFDGIVRSILFKAMLSGIDKAVFSDMQGDKFILLGFVQNNGKTLDSISEFLSKCKSCKK